MTTLEIRSWQPHAPSIQQVRADVRAQAAAGWRMVKPVIVRAWQRWAPLGLQFRNYLQVLVVLGLPDDKAQKKDFLRADRVTPSTELVVAGFLRSAVTPLVDRLAEAQPFLRVSEPIRTPLGVERARRLNIPSLLVVRDPDGAVDSLVSLLPQVSRRVAYRAYVEYHRVITPGLDKFLVIDFPDASGELEAIAPRLDAEFGTHFADRLEPVRTSDRIAGVLTRAALARRPGRHRLATVDVETLDRSTAAARAAALATYERLNARNVALRRLAA